MEGPRSISLSGCCVDIKASHVRTSRTNEEAITWLIESLLQRLHHTSQYANNRAELSHEPTRLRERGMRKFKSVKKAQRFLGAHAAVYNLFNLGRHLVSAESSRFFRQRDFASCEKAVTI